MQTCCFQAHARVLAVPLRAMCFAVFLLTACCEGLGAQTLVNELETFPVSTPADERGVLLYLPVHASKGHFGEDLKAADLVITDGGRRIDSHEVRVTLDANGDRLVTFVFDRLSPGNARSAAVIANRVLKEMAGEAGAMGVWTIDHRLHVVQTYTADRALAVEAMRAATAGRGDFIDTAVAEKASTEAGSKEERWTVASRDVVGFAERIVIERHAPWGLASLMAAAESERTIPGRKAIVYFTEESPSDLKAADMFKTVAQQLQDASISLFAVDMNAVDGTASDGMQAAIAMGNKATVNRAAVQAADPRAKLGKTLGMQPLASKAMNDTISSLEFDSMAGDKNLLADAAQASGGAYTNGGSGTRKISRRLVADLASYYTVTYPLPSERRDGKFHAVLVRATQPGMNIEARLGYYALKLGSPGAGPGLNVRGGGSGGMNDLQRLLEGASGEGLGVQSSVLRFGESPGGLHAVIALEVPIAELDLREDANTELFSLHASVATEIRSAAGAPVARFQEEFQRHGAVEAEDMFRTQVLSSARPVSLHPGEYVLESVVRDWNTGRIGRSVKAIRLGDGDGSGSVSDVVLVRATKENAGEKGSAAGPGALHYGKVQVVPNLSGEMEGSAKTASLYFQVYTELGERALRVEVSRGGKLLGILPLRMNAHGQGGSAQVVTVPLGAGSGEYDLALCIEHEGKVIRREVSAKVAETRLEEGAAAASGKTAKSDDEALALLEVGLTSVKGKTLSVLESAKLIEEARTHALAYATTLPNFLCVEKIDRTADHKGTGVWKHRDSIVEVLRYQDKTENRTVLEINGEKSSVAADHLEGARSNGEFGSVLKAIFAPEAAAAFEWEKSEEDGGEVLQVYRYKVGAGGSQFFVTDHSGSQIRSAFHGLVAVDEGTRAVRRLIAQTDELPVKFGVRSSWMAINYDYIAINNHDYLLPTGGEVGLTQGKREVILNRLRFSEYRRFGSKSRIVDSADFVR